MFRIGIRREDKTDQERRAPLAPHHVRQLIKDNVVEIYVERAEQRVYSHDEYENAGAKVVDDLPECDLIMGVKEIPVSRLHAGKPHLFFSHTIKGQEYNMPLLQSILDQNCTLMDYEVVTDEQNRRLVFFGVQAGQAGMLNSLWSLGQRYQNLGIETPFKHLRQAKTYPSLDEAREAVSAVGGDDSTRRVTKTDNTVYLRDYWIWEGLTGCTGNLRSTQARNSSSRRAVKNA